MRSTVDRRNEIVQLINKNGKAKVEELSKYFSVSTVTIRNDLAYLEREGIIHRSYGGALIRDSVAIDASILEKRKLHVDEKRRIGISAASMILDGDSVILDSGTTTSEIARNIKDRKELTVMTNAINIASELAGSGEINVLLTGGTLRKQSYSLVGPQAEVILREYCFDKLFLGVDGFDLEFGLTTPNLFEARLNQVMVEVSKEIIAVADSSKFGRKSLCLIAKPNKITRVITDTKISREYYNSLTSLGIDVIRV